MTTKPTTTPAHREDSPVDRDVVVVGGSAAGLSAAVFLARYGLDTLVFSRGNSAIHQCAHIENYLGFPGGISPERFLALGQAHAECEGATVVEDRVEAVTRSEDGLRVETQDDRAVLTRYVVAASGYDGDYLAEFEADLRRAGEGFLATEGGRTPVDGLYAAGWLTDGTVHQVVVNAGDGARTALALARDDMSERYWPAVGERYVDWVVYDSRYGGADWDEHVEEWFHREMVPADVDIDNDRLEAACEDLKSEFLDRGISPDERERRDRAGQRQILDHLDDDVVLEYARSLDDGT